MATINEIAKIVGVSKATVSNVLNKKKRVSAETAQKVLDVCKQLNYSPNRMAAGLTTKRMNIIGLLLSEEGSVIKKYHTELIRGVLYACYKNAYRLLLDMCTQDSHSVYSSLISRADPIDGAIIATPLVHDERIQLMIEKKVPFVLIGRPSQEFGNGVLHVDVDNVDLAYKTTLHLLRLGHTEIGFLNGQPNTTINTDRLSGYVKALQEFGCAYIPSYVYNTDNTAATGRVSCEQLINNHPDITAILTSSDDVAVGVYDVLQRRGMSIPSQVSVIALGGDDYLDKLFPRLTTVLVDYTLLGREAVRLLLAKIKGEPIETNHVIIPVRIVEGESAARRQ